MPPRIIRGRTVCRIVDEDDTKRVRELDSHLSFFVAGAEHSQLYKNYVAKKRRKALGEDEVEEYDNTQCWDGKKHLLSEKRLQFLPGLLTRVVAFYTAIGIDIEIEDARPPPDEAFPVDILGKLKDQGKVPYGYQLDAVEKASSKTHGIIKMSTGAGKSLVAALLIAKLGKPTCLYVIGKDLLYQMHKLLSSLFDEPIGFIGDGRCEIHRINVATIWTVGGALGLKETRAEDESKEKSIASDKNKDIRRMLADSRVHILDECHLASCATVQGIARNIQPENVYGMSASPWRDDGSDLLIEAFLGERIVDISANQLIEGGYLVKPIIRFLPVPKKKKLGAKYQTVYKHYITENDTRNEMVVKGATKLVEQGFQTLVLFHSIKHGEILYDMLKDQVSCELLSGKDDSSRREEVKQRLESGEINCILASKIFDIGVDLPSLSGLVLAGAGKSSVRALQRIGRVIRKYPGKKIAAVIDFIDQAKFLQDHAEARRDIYSEEFDVQWLLNEKPR